MSLIALLLAAAGPAGACPIPNVDVTRALKAQPGAAAVAVTRARDPDSGEPVLRHQVTYRDGGAARLEQRNCRIRNLSVTLLSRAAEPSAAELARAGRVLGAAPTWRRFFRGADPAALLVAEPASAEWRARGGAARFSYGAGDRISAEGERSEAIVTVERGTAAPAPYRSSVTLSLSIGGED